MGARDNLEVRRVCSSSIRPEWFSAPTFDNSHISETPASRDLVPPSGLCGNCTPLHIPSHRNKHTVTLKNKNKSKNKSVIVLGIYKDYHVYTDINL